MGLVRVKPQRVEHTDGWAVASAGREQVRYEEGGRQALIGIDRGRHSSRLYVASLSWVDGDGETPLLEPHRNAVLDRIVEGLMAMGLESIERYSAPGEAAEH